VTRTNGDEPESERLDSFPSLDRDAGTGAEARLAQEPMESVPGATSEDWDAPREGKPFPMVVSGRRAGKAVAALAALGSELTRTRALLERVARESTAAMNEATAKLLLATATVRAQQVQIEELRAANEDARLLIRSAREREIALDLELRAYQEKELR
jgi:hypothetical protein